MSGLEAIGIAASLIQVAELGTKLSVKLFSFYRELKGANESIQDLSNDVAITSAILYELGESLKEDEQAKLYSKNAFGFLQDVLNQCEEVIQQIRDLTKYNENTEKTRLQQITDMFRQVILEPRLDPLKASLKRLKSRMLLLLNVIMYAGQLRSNNSPKMLQEQRDFIKVLLEEEQKTKMPAPTISHPVTINMSTDSQMVTLENPVKYQSSKNDKPSDLDEYSLLMQRMPQEINSCKSQLRESRYSRIKSGVLNIHSREILQFQLDHGQSILQHFDNSLFAEDIQDGSSETVYETEGEKESSHRGRHRYRSRSRRRSHSSDDNRSSHSHRHSRHSLHSHSRHSRSRSRSYSNSRAKTLHELGVGATAVAAGVAALRSKSNAGERKSRSRTRSRSRVVSQSEMYENRIMSEPRRHMVCPVLAGAAATDFMVKDRSHSRSPKSKRSRSRAPSQSYPDPARDSAGLIEYGNDPVAGSIPAEHYYSQLGSSQPYLEGPESYGARRQTRSRSRGDRYSSSSGSDRDRDHGNRRRKHRSRSRDLAGAAHTFNERESLNSSNLDPKAQRVEKQANPKASVSSDSEDADGWFPAVEEAVIIDKNESPSPNGTLEMLVLQWTNLRPEEIPAL